MEKIRLALIFCLGLSLFLAFTYSNYAFAQSQVCGDDGASKVCFDNSYYKIDTDFSTIAVTDNRATGSTVTVFVTSDLGQNDTITLNQDTMNPASFTRMVKFISGDTDCPSNSPSCKIHARAGHFADVIYQDEVDQMALIYRDNLPVVMFDYDTYAKGYDAAISVIDQTANTNTVSVDVKSSGTGDHISVTLDKVQGLNDVYVSPGRLQLIDTTFSGADGTISLKVADDDSVTANYNNGAAPTTVTVKKQNVITRGAGLGGQDPATFGQAAPQYTANCANFGGDSDNDGICNNWETTTGRLNVAISGFTPYSYPVCTSNDNPSLTLSTCMGPGNTANPLDPTTGNKYKKDVYVDVDYYTSFLPDGNALKDVVNAFSKQGINLHIQLQNGPITDAVINGNPPTQTVISFPSNYDTIRQDQFARDHQDQKVSKSQVFHYALWAYQMSGADLNTSGYGEIIGNDLIVSLGNWPGVVNAAGVRIATAAANPPSTDLQEGTFMHELGHNLGLNHGGATSDSTNCKPNYISVMNYIDQFSSVYPSRQNPSLKRSLDYSNFTGTALTESGLLDNNGIGVVSGNSQYTKYAVSPFTGAYNTTDVLRSAAPASAIDFDNTDDSDETQQISRDLNSFGITTCMGETPVQETLNGFNDWNSLVLNFRTSSNFNTDSVHTDPKVEHEMTLDTYYNILKFNILHAGSIVQQLASYNAKNYIDSSFKAAAKSIDDGNIAVAESDLQNIASYNITKWITEPTDQSVARMAVDSELNALGNVVTLQPTCTDGQELVNGVCQCPAGQQLVNGVCVPSPQPPTPWVIAIAVIIVVTIIGIWTPVRRR